MNDQHAAVAESNRALEVFAAELTAATYRVAFRHVAADKWLDLELDLWRALAESVRERKGIVQGDSMKPRN